MYPTYEFNVTLLKNQYLLLRHLRSYTENRHREFGYKNLEYGHCGGLTALWFYCRWLTSTQLDRIPEKSNDYEWFQRVTKKIYEFDYGQDEKNQNPADDKEIEEFIAYLEMLHNPSLFSPQLSRDNLDQYFTDTKGRKLEKSFSSAIGLSEHINEAKKAIKALLRKDLIQDRTYISLRSTGELGGGHYTGIFREGDKLYYFDSNRENIMDPDPSFNLSNDRDLDKLVDTIYMAHFLTIPKRVFPALGINVFSFTPESYGKNVVPVKEPYPTQETLMEDVKQDADTLFCGLVMGIKMNDSDSVKYYLAQGANFNKVDDITGFSAFTMAIESDNKEFIAAMRDSKNPPLDPETIVKTLIDTYGILSPNFIESVKQLLIKLTSEQIGRVLIAVANCKKEDENPEVFAAILERYISMQAAKPKDILLLIKGAFNIAINKGNFKTAGILLQQGFKALKPKEQKEISTMQSKLETAKEAALPRVIKPMQG